MNKAYFFGHIGRDCDVRQTNNATPVANFPLGVNVGYGQNQQTLWVDCALFGKRAQGNLPQYLVKGAAVVVDGELNQRVYQKQDGTTGAAVTLNVQELVLLGAVKGRGNNLSHKSHRVNQLRKAPDSSSKFRLMTLMTIFRS